MRRRRTYRRRRPVRARRRLPLSVVRTTAYRIPVRGQPRPVLGPLNAWHKRVVQFSISNTGTSIIAADFLWQNLFSAWGGTPTFNPNLAVKVRWSKVYNTTLGQSLTTSFILKNMTTDPDEPDLNLQDYGNGASLASTGMKIPYQKQNIYQGFTSATLALPLITAQVQPNATILFVVGFSFRM